MQVFNKLNKQRVRRLLKLITALKSGKYNKTEYRLKNEDSYCVFGVTTDLYIKSHKNRPELVWRHEGVFMDNDFYYLAAPKQVITYYGLTDYGVLSLLRKNDYNKWSFLRIANWLEKQLSKELEEPKTKRIKK